MSWALQYAPNVPVFRIKLLDSFHACRFEQWYVQFPASPPGRWTSWVTGLCSSAMGMGLSRDSWSSGYAHAIQSYQYHGNCVGLSELGYHCWDRLEWWEGVHRSNLIPRDQHDVDKGHPMIQIWWHKLLTFPVVECREEVDPWETSEYQFQ